MNFCCQRRLTCHKQRFCLSVCGGAGISMKARALPSPIGVGKARALLLVCPTDRKEVPQPLVSRYFACLVVPRLHL